MSRATEMLKQREQAQAAMRLNLEDMQRMQARVHALPDLLRDLRRADRLAGWGETAQASAAATQMVEQQQRALGQLVQAITRVQATIAWEEECTRERQQRDADDADDAS